MTRMAFMLCALLLLTGGPASPDDASAQAREVAELRREVRELRAALRLMMDLDRERLDIIGRMLGEGAPPAGPRTSLGARVPNEAPAAGDANPSSIRGGAATRPAADPASPDGAEKGTVSGKLPLPESGVAFVYVENAGNRLVHGRTIEIRQSNQQFQPRWAVVQQGTEIRFPNLDSTYHNVFSTSPNANFDLGLLRVGDPGKSVVFNQPGVADIYCNQHPEMSATVLVVPNPFFTQVAPDGSFTLSGVTGGRRKIVAWTPHAELVSKWVTVEPGRSVSVSLELGKSEERAHLDKTGRPYGSYH